MTGGPNLAIFKNVGHPPMENSMRGINEARRPQRILRRISMVFVGLFAVIIVLCTVFSIAVRMALNTEGVAVGTVQKTVTSKDGTTIAFEQSGTGPTVVLVSAALADRDGTAKLAKLLSQKFTVINYDRRGRGKSTDTHPYAVEREVEDLNALIDAAGGSAYLFGSSSGAALALEAASRLGTRSRASLCMSHPSSLTAAVRPCRRILPGKLTSWW